MSSKPNSAKALNRSYGVERVSTALLGVLALLAGTAALLVGYRVLGEFRGQRSLLDPLAVNWVDGHLTLTRVAAIVLGLLLLVLGLWWFRRSLRMEGRPDLFLDRSPGQELTVTNAAIANAIRADLASLPAVSKARVRSVGDTRNPALRLNLALHKESDIKQAWEEIHSALERARTSLGMPKLPAAICLEVETTSPQRVQ